MVTSVSQTKTVAPIQISRNSAKISPKAILWCCDYSFMFLFPLWLWSSLAPGSWKRICSTSSVGTTFGGKARLWLPFFILLYWKACSSMKSLDFLPKLFFSSQTFQNLASDQTKVADLSSEIKVQKSVSMCKKISSKIPPYFFFL